MKIEEKIMELILFIGNLIGFSMLYLSLYLFRVVSIETLFIISFVTALFYTKQQLSKWDLENKIFELKELIESFKK